MPAGFNQGGPRGAQFTPDKVCMRCERDGATRCSCPATELYDACERALAIIPERGGIHSTTSMVRVRLKSALAKARGEQ